jgi:hypothetical protein
LAALLPPWPRQKVAMSISRPSRDEQVRPHPDPLFGPRAAFLVSIAAAASIIPFGLLPDLLLMPVISILLFVLAMVFALVAWVRCSTDEYAVSYRDVAGALAFIGIGAAALVEPEQLVRLVAGEPTQP